MNSAWSDPVLSCAGAKSLEARLFAGDEDQEWAAMRRAGAAVADAVLEDFQEIGGFPAAGRILALVGKGHNGGDALLATQGILREHPGALADVVFAFGGRSLHPLAARAWRELLGGTGLPTRVRSLAMGQETHATPYDVCLDGIFGFQFHPPLDAATAELMDWVNSHPAIRLRAAVDLPSGLGELERIEHPVFRADFTYATGVVKLPVVNPAHAAWVGRLRYLNLGFFDHGQVGSPLAGDATTDSRASAFPAESKYRILKPSLLGPLQGLRPPESDKRTFGHLYVVGGSRNLPGSVLMAVRAALRSGVGLVTAFVPESFVPPFAARVPEAMWVGWPETAAGGLALEGGHLFRERLGRATAVVMGPGLGPEAETLAIAADMVANSPVPLVLDADALRPDIVRAGRAPRILTPHQGEYARIRGDGDGADLFGAGNTVVVVKGRLTSVTRGDGRAFLSPFGGPVLARGGSGDLLAGLIGGLLAQAPADPLAAACRGVVWHGLAADRLARECGQTGVEVTQLLDHLPAALRVAADER